jgi:hypothetical protein
VNDIIADAYEHHGLMMKTFPFGIPVASDRS